MILEQTLEKHIPATAPDTYRKPLLIGDSLHILNPVIAKAIGERDNTTLLAEAAREIDAGAQALSINLGPEKKMSLQAPWLVETLMAEFNLPLFISAGVMADLRILDKFGTQITINAVTANPITLPGHIKTAKRYGSNLVVLLVKPDLVPSGTRDRMELAAEVISRSIEIGLPFDRLYIDPVISCRQDPVARKISRGMPDTGSIIDTLTWIQELDQDIKTIVALEGGTHGLAAGKKSIVQGRLFNLLAEAGLDAVILNCLDKKLMAHVDQEKTVKIVAH